jgi:hypothetical protein
MAKYLEDRDLLYEIILSKGKITTVISPSKSFLVD